MLPSIEAQALLRSKDHVDVSRASSLSILTRTFKGRISDPDGAWDVVEIGSRSSFRAWGLWGLRAYRRLPILAHVRSTPEGSGSVIDIRLANDEGYYAYRLPAVERAYRRAFEEIIDTLRRG